MREKLIEILRVPIYTHELADPTEAVADYLLDNDVVPVVRCKDCVWCEKGKAYVPYCNHPTDGMHDVQMDDFCSYGERKDNA